MAIIAIPLLAGCAMFEPSVGLPDTRKVIREPLVIHSDFYFPKRHRLVEELLAKRGDIEQALDVEISDELIHIFLFEDHDRFSRYLQTHHPTFPDRRAFFLQTSTSLIVYAHWNARVAEDLRHEVTHSYVHSVLPNISLWLDEGIAEYFEVARADDSINRPHVALLLAELESQRWQPDLARLESLTQPGDLNQTDYAEAWLWVHYLLHHDDVTQDALKETLAEVRVAKKDVLLHPRLQAAQSDATEQVIAHLRGLASQVN